MSEDETLEVRKLSLIKRIADSLTWGDLLQDLGDEYYRLRKELLKR